MIEKKGHIQQPILFFNHFPFSQTMTGVPLFKAPSHFSKPKSQAAQPQPPPPAQADPIPMYDDADDEADLDYNEGGRGGGGGGGGGNDWRRAASSPPSEANEFNNPRLRRSQRSVMNNSESEAEDDGDEGKKKKKEEFDPGTHFLMDAYLYTPPPRPPVMNEKWIEDAQKQAKEENEKVANNPLFGRVNSYNQSCYACENRGDKCTNYSGDSETWNQLRLYMNDLTKPPHYRCRLLQDYYHTYVVGEAKKHMTLDMWYDHMFFHEIERKRINDLQIRNLLQLQHYNMAHALPTKGGPAKSSVVKDIILITKQLNVQLTLQHRWSAASS